MSYKKQKVNTKEIGDNLKKKKSNGLKNLNRNINSKKKRLKD